MTAVYLELGKDVEMSTGKICSRSVVVIGPDETIREAARRMNQYSVGSLVVQDDGQGPLGILSDRDIAIRCVAGGLDPDTDTVGDSMTSPVRSVKEATPIEAALSLMAGAGVRRLPVVDEDERVVGILSVDDVLGLLSEEIETIGKLLARYEPDIPED